MKAFMVIRTASDLLTAIDVMRAGYTLGIAAEPGHLWGPTRPKTLHLETPNIPRSSRVLALRVENLTEFLTTYLTETGIEPHVHVDAASDAVWIERVWRLLNYSAGIPLSRTAILDLVVILAAYVGGRVQPHLAYGDPDWVAYCKAGAGALMCWCKPAPTDMLDLVKLKVPLINAANLRPGMVGMVGPAQMPDRGLIRSKQGQRIIRAYDASGAPTGFGPLWDAQARRTRLVGLPVPAEWPLAMRQGLEMQARTHARTVAGQPLSQLVWTCEGDGDLTRVGNPRHLTEMRLPCIPLTVQYLNQFWDDVLKVTFYG